MDFAKFNFDIKQETYILITSEKYKSERTASKWFLQYSVHCPFQLFFIAVGEIPQAPMEESFTSQVYYK